MASEEISIVYNHEHLRFMIERATQICFNCEHFHLHYTRHGNCMLALHDGHCCYPRMKNRQITDTCEHFHNKHETPKLNLKEGT